MDKVIVILYLHKLNKKIDIEVPIDITVKELILGLNKAYSLGMNIKNIKDLFIRSENPIALLKGDRTLREYKIKNGTILNVIE